MLGYVYVGLVWIALVGILESYGQWDWGLGWHDLQRLGWLIYLSVWLSLLLDLLLVLLLVLQSVSSLLHVLIVHHAGWPPQVLLHVFLTGVYRAIKHQMSWLTTDMT